jgi:PAS domain S-box-containing protein
MATPKADGKSGPPTVVFADNDPIVLEAITELLRTKGYEVHPTKDGLEALQAIRRIHPTYVILDIVMPKIDGSRVCWLVRQDPQLRNTPIIAFSALSPEQIRRFPELSADAYVAKGPLAVVAGNILMAIKNLEERGRGDLQGGIFGYEGFQSRRLISEMLVLKRYWEVLVRTFDHGVLGLDEEGRILMANPAASRLLGKKEVRLIGESVVALTAMSDREAIQHTLSEIKKVRLPEDYRMEATFGKRRLRLRLSGIVEDGACTGILVILEPHVVESGGAAGTGTGAS